MLTSRSVVAKILWSLLPKCDHVVVSIEETENFSRITKEELQGTLKSHEKRMAERSTSKTKSDVAPHAHSTKEKKDK